MVLTGCFYKWEGSNRMRYTAVNGPVTAIEAPQQISHQLTFHILKYPCSQVLCFHGGTDPDHPKAKSF